VIREEVFGDLDFAEDFVVPYFEVLVRHHLFGLLSFFFFDVGSIDGCDKFLNS
jgi:hypothetical protein